MTDSDAVFVYDVTPTEEYEEFLEVLENHEFLTFDPKSEKLWFVHGSILDFLNENFDSTLLELLNLNSIQEAYCTILHPSVFDFIVSPNAIGATIHRMNSLMVIDVANMLGLPIENFLDKPIILLRADRLGNFNKYEIIHEATHVSIPPTKSSKLDETYMKNPDELVAICNELLAAKYDHPEYTITDYVKIKDKKVNDRELSPAYFIYLNLWDKLTVQENLSNEEKIKLIKKTA